jgi:hypothetical protein
MGRREINTEYWLRKLLDMQPLEREKQKKRG